MRVKKTLTAFALGVFLILGIEAQSAWAADVYVVYSGRNKALRDQVVGALSSNLSVKAYPVDLLAVADYSGKQKALAKINRAQLVVFLGDKPSDIFKGTRRMRRDLVIVASVKGNVVSSRLTLYVVSKNTSISGLTGSRISVNNKEDLEELKNREKIRSSKVVLVDENAVRLHEAVSVIAQVLIG